MGLVKDYWGKQDINELIQENKDKKYLPSYNNLLNSLKKLKDFERIMEKIKPYSKPSLKVKKETEKYNIQELIIYY